MLVCVYIYYEKQKQKRQIDRQKDRKNTLYFKYREKKF